MITQDQHNETQNKSCSHRFAAEPLFRSLLGAWILLALSTYYRLVPLTYGTSEVTEEDVRSLHGSDNFIFCKRK